MNDRAPIDRDLARADLERLAALVAPLIEARLQFLAGLRVGPVKVGEILLRKLSGSPARMTSEAMAKLLELPDAELAALVDLVGRELGAWRGYGTPADGPAIAAARPGWERLVGALDD